MSDSQPYRLPMFPLGTTLLPGAALPLNVFEPRYTALLEHCLDPDHPRHDPAHAAEFGVVLIERGHEVGGGDVRTSVGTVARIVDAQSSDDRYRVLAVGVRRLRVTRWLPDDPYPLADVTDWDDDRETHERAVVDSPSIEAAFDVVRRVLALSVELGDIPSDYLQRVPGELASDPAWATYQLAALAPIGSADRQRILNGRTVADRLVVIDEALEDIEMTLRFRLSS